MTYDDASAARNTTAPTASDTSINRPTGERAANASTNAAGWPFSIPCGVTVLTRTPLRAPVRREVARQVDQGGLGDGVRDRLEELVACLSTEVVEALVGRENAVDGADVDDRAAPRARHRAADHLAGDDDAEDVDVDDVLEGVERDVLESADLGGRGVGRRVDRGGVDEEVRDAPVDLDQRQRRLDVPSVGDVALVDADRPLVERGREACGAGARRRLDVEDRHPHAASRERHRELGPELSHPARDDGDTAGEVEERVAHGAIVTLTEQENDGLRALVARASGSGYRMPPPIGGVGSPRMGGALLLAAAVVLLGCVGWYLPAALGIDSPALRVLGAYPIAWAGLVAAAVLLSIPGWLDGGSLVVAIAALAAASFVVARHRSPGLAPVPWTAWREALADPVVRTLAIAVAVAGVYLAAAAFLTTPNDWDGLTYHETRALLWDAQGRVGYVPSGNDPRLDGNPPVSEIGLYAALVLPHSERFAALPQFVALWASLLAVVPIARRLGLPRAASAFGGLVFATLPVVLLHGAAVLNDLVVASFLLVAAGFLAGRSRAELIVGSVALGLALSTKFSAALSLPVLVAAVLALAPARRRAASLVACGGGVLLGAPWYVINLAETGSLDGGLGDTTGQAADHSVRGVLGTLRALVFDVVDTTGLWRSELTSRSWWAPAWSHLACCS